MKTIGTLVAAAALLVGGHALAGGKHDDHTPKHGGLVVEGKQADFELVAKPEVIQLYLRDHGKAMSRREGVSEGHASERLGQARSHAGACR